MRHTVFTWYDHGTHFCGSGAVCYYRVFVQNISEKIRQRENPIDVVLVFAHIVETCETGCPSVLCEMVDKMNESEAFL
jgi:hypothetical protein